MIIRKNTCNSKYSKISKNALVTIFWIILILQLDVFQKFIKLLRRIQINNMQLK